MTSITHGFQCGAIAVVCFFVICLVAARSWSDAVPAVGVQRERCRIAGRASWYGEKYRGRTMANGKPFNPDRYTCASYAYPLGTWLRVTYAPDGERSRSVVVQVTDRGPDDSLHRLIDLSLAAFQKLEAPALGLIDVEVEVMG